MEFKESHFIWLGFSIYKTGNTTGLALTHTTMFHAQHELEGKKNNNNKHKKLTAQHNFPACVPSSA